MQYVYGKSQLVFHSVLIEEGKPWDADDPFVKEHPEFFASDPPAHTVGRTTTRVEQATANPGEKRNARG